MVREIILEEVKVKLKVKDGWWQEFSGDGRVCRVEGIVCKGRGGRKLLFLGECKQFRMCVKGMVGDRDGEGDRGQMIGVVNLS